MDINRATLPELLRRGTLADLFDDPLYPYWIDWRAITTFDPHDERHHVLVDALTEALVEHALIQRELERAGRPKVDASPLDLRFSRGYGLVEAYVAVGAPSLAGTLLFRLTFGAAPEAFRPGAWLGRMREVQLTGRQAIRDLMGSLKERRLEGAPDEFQAVDDSGLFS